MNRTTPLYTIIANNSQGRQLIDPANELSDLEHIYYSFGYNGTIQQDMVCIFCIRNKHKTLLTIYETKKLFRYHTDIPVDNNNENIILKQFNKIWDTDITELHNE